MENYKKDNRFDLLKFISSQVSDQLRQADTKAVSIFGVLGILTGLLVNKINSLKFSEWFERPISMILIFISLFLVILSFKFALRVLYPRKSVSDKKSLSFFGDISSLKKEEYISLVSEVEEGESINILSLNVWNLSSVASKKYNALKTAFMLGIFSLIFTIIVLVVA
ncbi:MAG: hypothetical protein EXS49_02515 [Candidatus Pacebacteria bacterium]|nr:hypothetical protein [Candidatus Paceibacterota bacterium]